MSKLCLVGPSDQKLGNTTQKNPEKWGLKNLVRAGNSEMMYDFYLYTGKDETLKTEYEDLQKCSIVVAQLCKRLAEHKSHKHFLEIGSQLFLFSITPRWKVSMLLEPLEQIALLTVQCCLIRKFKRQVEVHWITEVIQTQVWLLQNVSITKLYSFVQIMLVSIQCQQFNVGTKQKSHRFPFNVYQSLQCTTRAWVVLIWSICWLHCIESM